MMHTGRWRLLCLVLIGLGLIVSGYLMARSFSLVVNRSPHAMDLCSEIFGAGCDEALLSSTSWQMGIPLAGWGVVYYATLVCLIVLAWGLGEAFELEATLGALLLAAAGACGSIILAWVLVGGKVPFCPLCLVVHVINLALVPVLWRLNGRTAGQLFQALKGAAGYLVGREPKDPREARWKVLGFVTVALITVVLYQWVFVESKLRLAPAKEAFKPGEVTAAYASTPKQNVFIGTDDPMLGPAEAPVKLVVFSSFQCSGCKTFAQKIKNLTEIFQDKLTVIFKHFPFGKACNPALRVEMFPWACEAAWAAVAAHRQGRFWPFHDDLFASDLNISEETIQQVARNVGLDLVQFEADRRAKATIEKVRADLEQGERLRVDGTPAVFLDGRRVRNLSTRAIALLIGQQIAAGQ